MTKNMAEFWRGAALVLAQLYEECPQEINIELQKLYSTTEESTLKNYAQAVRRMEQWGWIEIGGEPDQDFTFFDVVLTDYGYANLDKQYKEGQTYGQVLKAWATMYSHKDTQPEHLQMIIQQAFR